MRKARGLREIGVNYLNGSGSYDNGTSKKYNQES